jgi:PUA domain protein
MPEKYRRYFLKDKEAKALLSKVSDRLRVHIEQVLSGKASFEVVETEFAEIFLIKGKPLLAKTAETVYPTLVFDEFTVSAPKAVVDMGAIPYVCKGANVMAPGIRRFEGEFKKGDLVLVADEKYGKALAIGETLYDSEEAKKTRQGVVVKNVHFVGDKTWNFIKKTYGESLAKI